MIRLSQLILLFVFAITGYIPSMAQPPKECTDCFHSEIISYSEEEGCPVFEIKVWNDEPCSYALSHLTFTLPCYTIIDGGVSEKWKIEVKKNEFKVDDIKGFAEDGKPGSFTFWVKACPDEDCEDKEDKTACIEPVISYKAALCVTSETLSANCSTLTAELAKQDVTCHGADNGKLSVTVLEGVAPYTYSWSNEETSAEIKDLSPGRYTVIVTDASGQTIDLAAEIKEPESLQIKETITPASCPDFNNGSIILDLSGGFSPYKIKWNDGESGAERSGLAAGRYEATVTDAKGCAATGYFDVPEANNLSVKLVSKNTGCTDDGSGSIQAEISGGTPPYTYAWSNGATEKDISGLTTGQYVLTVTDENGCVKEAKATIEADKLQMYASKRMPVCHGDANGILDVTIINGVEPVNYEWSNGANTQDIDNLTAGTYSLTATDARGCSATAAHYLPQPSPIVLTARISGAECSGKWGTVELTAKGGGGSFKYNWSTGDLTKDLHNAAPGDYQVTVTDQYGCSATGDFTVKSENIMPPDLSCTILQPEITPVCGTENNKLLALSETAVTYRWEITSSDGSWEIREGQNTAMLTYKAGNENSSAAFKLTTTNVNGCESTCELQLTACKPVEEPGNCSERFFAQVTENKSQGDCQRYTVQISRADAVNYELSHLVIEPPCGEIINIENSGGWKIETVTDDKTTGMTGIKIDNIDNFGKSDQEYFTISFTVCETAMCDAPCWTPVIGYKAGPCVTYEMLPVVCHTISSSPDLKVSASGLVTYPNPARGPVSIKLPGQINGKVRIEIINAQGVKYQVLERHIESADPVSIDTDNLPNDVYIVKILAKNEAVFGRFILLR